MSKQQKTFGIEIVEKNDDGGQIIINTDSVDRDHDRVFPTGANVVNYLRNPVVQFGHNYRDPWATVGRTDTLEVSENAINARFTLRPAANEHDPQNIVRLLWVGEWIRTASIGFMPGILPKETQENEFGGIDFLKWDLLEWSLVPIPANQDALRQAVKGFLPLALADDPDEPIEAQPEIEAELAKLDLVLPAQRRRVFLVGTDQTYSTNNTNTSSISRVVSQETDQPAESARSEREGIGDDQPMPEAAESDNEQPEDTADPPTNDTPVPDITDDIEYTQEDEAQIAEALLNVVREISRSLD